MANEQNLITPQELNARLTPEKRKANASKAGKASVKARRERKTIAQCLNAYLDEVDTGSGLTRRELLAMKVIKNAFDKGEARDLKILTELVGELTQKFEVENKNPIVLLPDGVLESIQKQAK